MLPRSRSRTWILASAAVLAAGVLWLSSRVRERPAVGDAIPNTPSAQRVLPVDAPASPALERASAIPSGPAIQAPASREVAPPDPDAELKAAYWVEGRVELPPGTPADEHVEVLANGAIFENRPRFRAPIAADGSFRVAFARDTGFGTLELSARYLILPTLTTLSFPLDKTRIVLQPILGGCIRGRLLLPLAGLDLRSSLVDASVRATGGASATLGVGFVDSNLEFEIDALPARAYSVSIETPRIALSTRDGLVVEPGRLVSTEIELRLAASIAGQVVDPSGLPANRAQVRARSAFDLGDRIAYLRTDSDRDTTTDPDGRFELGGLTPGTWSIQASSQGLAPSDELLFDVSAGEVNSSSRLALHKSGRIAGHVLGPDAKPMDGIAVVLFADPPSSNRRNGAAQPRRVTSEDGGFFAFDDLGPDTYRVRARGSDRNCVGAGSTIEGIRILDGSVVDDLVLALGPSARIEGLVTAPDGNPVAGARIDLPAEEFNRSLWDAQTIHAAISDASGRFTLQQITPGTTWIQALAPGPRLRGELSVEAPPGQTVSVELRTSRASPLNVTLEGEEALLRAASVAVSDGKGKSWLVSKLQRIERTTPKSRSVVYAFDELVPYGTYTVRAWSTGGASASGETKVSEQTSARVVLQLKR